MNLGKRIGLSRPGWIDHECGRRSCGASAYSAGRYFGTGRTSAQVAHIVSALDEYGRTLTGDIGEAQAVVDDWNGDVR